MKPLRPHPDRAFPADPATRAVARRIYDQTRDLPLVSMHGHVDVEVFAGDEPFSDPAQLLVVPDHYVTRMLVSQGVPLAELGVDPSVPVDSREVWRRFCENWHLFRGTPSRYWLEHELADVLGVDLTPSGKDAETIYDQIAARLAEPDFRPRALLDRFRLEVLATTDPADSELRGHARLAADGYAGRIVPTFRPDALVHVARPGWPADVQRLGTRAGVDTGSYAGFIAALRLRRQAFLAAGAMATDHGHFSADTTRLADTQAERIYADALRGAASPADAAAFAGHMLHVMAELSAQDGLVMQIHPGVWRNYDPGVHERFGSDMGFDIPVAAEFTRALHPILSRLGHAPGLRIILFTVDETVYSRELAPLAGAYPAVRLGAPWWFLDSPDGMRRFRELVTETAGFYNTSGFVDDTRAFLSIPARHDLARRIDAGYLARLVVEHRLDEDEAADTAVDLAYRLPQESYRRRPSS